MHTRTRTYAHSVQLFGNPQIFDVQSCLHSTRLKKVLNWMSVYLSMYGQKNKSKAENKKEKNKNA